MSPAATRTTTGARAASGDYGYGNARVRGMRARLMRGDALERLMEAPDLQHLIQELMQTEYAPDLEEVLIAGRTADTVDAALRRNVVRTYRKVLRFLNDEAHEIMTTLLGRWDVFNVKTVLRGKHVGLTAEEISTGLFPVGALSQVDLDGLLMQSDVRGVVDTAGTWELPQSPAMRQGYIEYQKSGELADLELALDRYYSEWAARRLWRRGPNYAIARRMLHMQTDILNLVMVFRAARESLEPQQSADYFLHGGKDVGFDLYQRLTALADIDEIVDGLKGTPYHTICDEAAIRYLETLSLAVFERALEDHFTRKVVALGGTDPLGIGIPIAYLWSKQNEVTNIRIVVKGKDVGIPASSMRKEFILV